jgi:hypothetical protein
MMTKTRAKCREREREEIELDITRSSSISSSSSMICTMYWSREELLYILYVVLVFKSQSQVARIHTSDRKVNTNSSVSLVPL